MKNELLEEFLALKESNDGPFEFKMKLDDTKSNDIAEVMSAAGDADVVCTADGTLALKVN